MKKWLLDWLFAEVEHPHISTYKKMYRNQLAQSEQLRGVILKAKQFAWIQLIEEFDDMDHDTGPWAELVKILHEEIRL